MVWGEADEQLMIKKLSYHLDGEECVLTWHWPKDLDYVYVYSYKEGEELPPEKLQETSLKLFSRNEYKAKSGYRERVSFIGSHIYRVFPCDIGEGNRLTGLNQRTADNVVRVSGTRARIEYQIKYANQWFGKYRKARITVFCEIPVPKETLLYVKNEGGIPLSPEDGVAYPFLADFPSGETALPEIYIKKNEFLRIFFANGKVHGESYELIQR